MTLKPYLSLRSFGLKVSAVPSWCSLTIPMIREVAAWLRALYQRSDGSRSHAIRFSTLRDWVSTAAKQGIQKSISGIFVELRQGSPSYLDIDVWSGTGGAGCSAFLCSLIGFASYRTFAYVAWTSLDSVYRHQRRCLVESLTCIPFSMKDCHAVSVND